MEVNFKYVRCQVCTAQIRTSLAVTSSRLPVQVTLSEHPADSVNDINAIEKRPLSSELGCEWVS